MEGKVVHHGYANLKDSIMSSEVLASKYANEVSRAGFNGDKENIISHMEQLDKILKESGVVISNALLEVFSEITVFLGEHNNLDLMGKVPGAISALYKSSLQDQTKSAVYIDKLKSLTEELSEQVTDLKRTSITMKAVMPRMKIKAKRTRQDGETSKGKSHHDSDMEVDNQGRSTGGKTKANKESTPLTFQSMETPSEGEAERLKEVYRKYYSYDKFSKLPHEKQFALVEYYMAHIIRVRMEEFEDDTEIYNMLSDIIDKERLMAYCKLAEEGELTEAMIEDAIFDTLDVINACSPAYGRYIVNIIEKNEVPTLHIHSY